MLTKRCGCLLILCFVAIASAHEGKHTPLDATSTDLLKQKIKTFELRLNKNATDMNALIQLGHLYEKLGRATGSHSDFEKASGYFERILEIDPVHAQALHGLCLTALARHQFKQGLQFARALAEVAPNDIETMLLLGDAHFFLGNYTEAGVFFEQAHRDRQDLATIARMAQWFEARGNYPKAYEFMNQALAIAQANPEQKIQEAWVLTMLAEMDVQTNQLERANGRFKESLKADPNTHYAYWRLAAIHRHNGESQDARKIMHDLVHQQPRMAYFVTYGQIWQDLDRPDRAKYWFEKAESKALAEINAGDFGHVRDLVSLYAMTGKKLDIALKYALKEYEDIRQDAEGAEWVGWLYHLNGQAKKGMPYIRRAMRLGTATPRFQHRAAIVSQAAGEAMLAAQLLHVTKSEDALIDPKLAANAAKLKQWLKENPESIRAQFKKRMTAK